jgi:hypothetical protein
MASYKAIAAVSQAIVSIMNDGVPKTEFPDASFELFHAGSFKTAPGRKLVSLYLYRVTVNAAVRNAGMRQISEGHQRRPPLPLDLHYLLTVWWPDAIQQQRLLGSCMRELATNATLSSSLLNSPGPERNIFIETELVELVIDNLSIQDMLNITDAFKSDLQITVPYVARLVRIDAEDEAGGYPFVQTREFGVGHLVVE